MRFAAVVMALERSLTAGTTAVGAFSTPFETPHGFLTSTREEQARVLARLRWMQVPISIGNNEYTYRYRDILTAGLDALACAESVEFGEGGPSGAGASESGASAATASDQLHRDLVDIDDDDESRERHGALDGDFYQQERRNVRAVHGRTVLVMGVHLHADEALASWSGAHNIFPVRARYVNVIGQGGGWTTVGYIEHMPRAVGQSSARRLEVSDVRNDLLQRCLVVSLKTLARASESGITAPVAGRGDALLVPRIVALILDQPEERAILALMGNRCRYFCSPCLADKDDVPSASAIRAVDRDVVQTLDAQLAAAIVRHDDPRPGRRRALGQEHSALAFVPALGAVHGLSTGSRFLYQIVSFDLHHLWKLGILRLLAQRLPGFLTAFCPGGIARLGRTAYTLEVLNLRSFELDRNCNVCPSAPGMHPNLMSIAHVHALLYNIPQQRQLGSVSRCQVTSAPVHAKRKIVPKKQFKTSGRRHLSDGGHKLRWWGRAAPQSEVRLQWTRHRGRRRPRWRWRPPLMARRRDRRGYRLGWATSG